VQTSTLAKQFDDASKSLQTFASQQADAAYTKAISNMSAYYVQTSTFVKQFDDASKSLQTIVSQQAATLVSDAIANLSAVYVQATDLNVKVADTLNTANSFATKQASDAFDRAVASASSLYMSVNGFNNMMNNLIPAGTMWPYAGQSVAQLKGWLLCDGKDYLNTDYPLLYAAIGRVYTPATTNAQRFNVPNFTNRYLMGGTVAGLSGGSETVTLSSANMPSHSHGVRVGTRSNNTGSAIIPSAPTPSYALSATTATLNLTAQTEDESKGTWYPNYKVPSMLADQLDNGYRKSSSQTGSNYLFNQGGIMPAGRDVPTAISLSPPYITARMIIKADK
jgi:microcystin-dependent protein